MSMSEDTITVITTASHGLEAGYMIDIYTPINNSLWKIIICFIFRRPMKRVEIERQKVTAITGNNFTVSMGTEGDES